MKTFFALLAFVVCSVVVFAQTLTVTTTYTSSEITQNSAAGGGTVSYTGSSGDVTARGVCYNTSPSPTTANFKIRKGSGTGSFSCTLSGLTANTTYYLRAWAKTSAGTTYGNEIVFRTLAIPAYGTVTDIDGNTYTTVFIGSQEWMMENLRVTRYGNGDPIQNVTASTAWRNLSAATEKGAYCNYNNDAANVSTYGRLYNWYAVVDPRNIAPQGFRVPTKADWDLLETYLGNATPGSNTAYGIGRKLKEIGTAHWLSPNDANNVSGLTVLPGGWRSWSGGFTGMRSSGCVWSSSLNAGWAYFRRLDYNSANVTWVIAGPETDNYRLKGLSVRCVRDVVQKTQREESDMTADGYLLHRNYPNPFSAGCSGNPTTTIRYTIPEDGIVTLRVYDALGRMVAEVENGMKPAGSYTAVFKAGNLSSGTYLYRLEANGRSLTGKMHLMK